MQAATAANSNSGGIKGVRMTIHVGVQAVSLLTPGCTAMRIYAFCDKIAFKHGAL